LPFGIAEGVMEQADTKRTIERVLGEGQSQDVGLQPALSAVWKMSLGRELKHINALVSPNGTDPKVGK
jgi:hypothetical protein